MRQYFILCLVLILNTISIAQSSDLLFSETGIDRIRSSYGLYGENTIIAVFDRGIDYTHADFIDEDGKTRILGIWDLSDNSGASAPNNPYGAGTIYTEEMINQALSTGNRLNTRDAVGHGTVSAGIAAGNGSTSLQGIQGVAPKAKLIVVKITSEGAAAHGDQLAEAPFYASVFFDEAVEWVKGIAREKALPAVIFANYGSMQGPMDGTSRDAQTLNSLFPPEQTGLAFITGSSDDGGLKNHASSTLVQGEPIELTIIKNTFNLRLDLWYSQSDQLEFEITTPGGSLTTGPLSGPSDTKNASTSDFSMFHQGALFDFFGAENEKNELLIDFFGANGEIKLKITPVEISNGKWDASLNPSTIFMSEQNEFTDFAVEGSIWDLASANMNICPNSYIIRNDWTSVAGNTFSYPGHENGVNSLWTGSGIGPTFDGRIGIDVAVPGNINYGAYGSNSYFASLPSNLVEAGEHPYGVLAAVSGATPVLAGVIALMFEADSTLTIDEIKSILHTSAKADEFTGQVPNNRWGYGKLDAYKAIETILGPPSSLEDTELEMISAYPNPFSGKLTLEIGEEYSQPITFTMTNPLGEVIQQFSGTANQQNVEIDTHLWPAGQYFLQAITEDGILLSSTSLIKVD